MLILSRRVDEAIVLNDGEIKVQILSIKGKQVRVGIHAPPHISVHREEIQEKIDKGVDREQHSSDEKASV